MSSNHLLNFSDKKILFRIRAIVCPGCEVGQAVHKADAYQVYKTKKYAKPKRKKKSENLPPPSTFTEIEDALISPTFLEKIKPPPEVESIFDKVFGSNFILYSIIGLTVIVAVCVSIYLERLGYMTSRRRKDPKSSLLFSSLVALIFFLIWLLDYIRIAIRKIQYNRWCSSWYCLRCSKHFIVKID
jgi:hypothetical protein